MVDVTHGQFNRGLEMPAGEEGRQRESASQMPNQADAINLKEHHFIAGVGETEESSEEQTGTVLEYKPDLRKIISRLRGQIKEVISNNLYSGGKIGYLGKEDKTLCLSDVQERLLRTAEEFSHQADQLARSDQKGSIDFESLARAGEAKINEFVLGLSSAGFGDNLRGLDRQALLSNLINLRAEITNFALQIDNAYIEVEILNERKELVQESAEQNTEPQDMMLQFQPGGIFDRTLKSTVQVLSGGQPLVARITTALRKELIEYLKANRNLKRKEIGFTANNEAGKVDSLQDVQELMGRVSSALDGLVEESEDRTKVGLQLRAFAQNIQTKVDLMRVRMFCGSEPGPLSDSSLRSALHTMYEGQAELAADLVEMTAFLEELKASGGLEFPDDLEAA